MKNIIPQSVLLCIIAVLFTTCSKNYLQCTDGNTTKIPPHAMDFFFFKTGSWWVYEEETTGERDSIWVGLHELNSDPATSAKRDCGCGSGRCVQNARNTFFGRKANNQLLYGFSIWSDFKESGTTTISESGGLYNVASGYRITYYGKEYAKESPTYGTFEDLASVEVKGKTYNNILHLYYTNQTNIPDWLHEAWYARNIYLVKFRLWDETTWNLVNYHIVK